MSDSSRQQRTVRSARPGRRPRNLYLAAPARSALGESSGRRRDVPELPPAAIDQEGWDERVAREVRHQEVIEASFDRAEAHARLGDFEHALEWLDRAAALSGGLPAGYAAQRARWARAPASRPQPTAGDWKHRPARSGQSWAGRGLHPRRS
jgi:hypothetical protein